MSNLDFGSIIPSLGYLFGKGMALTLLLTVISSVLGLALGTLLAVMRLSKSGVISAFAGGYVNLMRSVPLILIIFWFFFLVPYIQAWIIGSPRPVPVGAMFSAIISFTVFEAAYFCEIVRAGFKSVRQGQISAGYAIGLTHPQVMTSVVIPQALRNMLPALFTRVIIIFQDTSFVYVLSMTDFLGAAEAIGQRDGRLTEMFLFVAAVYFIICFCASQLVSRLAARMQGA